MKLPSKLNHLLSRRMNASPSTWWTCSRGSRLRAQSAAPWIHTTSSSGWGTRPSLDASNRCHRPVHGFESNVIAERDGAKKYPPPVAKTQSTGACRCGDAIEVDRDEFPTPDSSRVDTGLPAT